MKKIDEKLRAKAIEMLEEDLDRGCARRVAEKLGLNYEYVLKLKKIAKARVKAKELYGKNKKLRDKSEKNL